jgi:hypothetical protein
MMTAEVSVGKTELVSAMPNLLEPDCGLRHSSPLL